MPPQKPNYQPPVGQPQPPLGPQPPPTPQPQPQMPSAQPTPAVVFGPQAPTTPSPQSANQPQPMPQPEPSPVAQPQPAAMPTQAVPGVVFGPQAQAAAPQPTIPAEAAEPNQTPQAPFQGLSPMTPLPKPTKTKSKGKRRLLKKLLLLIIITAALTTAGVLAYNKFLVSPSPEDSFQTAIDQLLQTKSLKLQITSQDPTSSSLPQLIIQTEYMDDPDKTIIKRQLSLTDTDNPDPQPLILTEILSKGQTYLQITSLGNYLSGSDDYQTVFDDFFKDKWLAYDVEEPAYSLPPFSFHVPAPDYLDSTKLDARRKLQKQYDFVKILLDELNETGTYSGGLDTLIYFFSPFGVLSNANDRQAVARGLFSQTDGAAVKLTDCQQGSEIVCKFISGQPTDELLDNLDNILPTSNPFYVPYYRLGAGAVVNTLGGLADVSLALKLDGQQPKSLRIFGGGADGDDSAPEYKVEYSAFNQPLGLTIPESSYTFDEFFNQKTARDYKTNAERLDHATSIKNKINTYIGDESSELPTAAADDRISSISFLSFLEYYTTAQIYWNGQPIDQPGEASAAILLINQPQTTEGSETASFPAADKRASPERDNLYIWTSASCNSANGLPQAASDANSFAIQFAVNDAELTSQCL